MEHWWKDTDGKTEVVGKKKSVLVPFSLLQLSRPLAWDRIQISAVGGPRLTAWGMAGLLGRGFRRNYLIRTAQYTHLPHV
jgi:hypothetical protein